MSHFTVSGTSVGSRVGALKDGILWNALKVVTIGGLIVSVPGVLAGSVIPAEGLSRGETIVKNLEHDHSVVWSWIGQGAQGVTQFMSESN